MLLVAFFRRATSVGRCLLFAACSAPPFLALVITSLPYLAREGRGELSMLNSPVVVSQLDDLLRMLLFVTPRVETLWTGGFAAVPSYYTPLSVFVFAILAITAARRRAVAGGFRELRLRVAVPALWGCVVVALILSIGSRLPLGDWSIALPGEWAARIIPGFSKIRAPHRWDILSGIALPVLAGIGLCASHAWLARRAAGSIGRRRIATVALGVAFALFVPWRSLPVSRNWNTLRADASLYRAISALPPGPLLELPWPADSLPRLGADANYLLASTLHWRPILNGVPGYAPSS